ncbi:TfoX/Sxy family DNA transformation protein [Photobacterium aquae]|uniref:TfoX/Sxy family DNA transformation protein n=1 Tax=Photobacterium aquae TaxID=1195763 RepID=UPI00069D3338|nr:TfoX/Sxy family DNA transformation protein [Photobacterium aquae]
MASMAENPLAALVLELGDFTLRNMFGLTGVFDDGDCISIIDENQIYLNAQGNIVDMCNKMKFEQYEPDKDYRKRFSHYFCITTLTDDPVILARYLYLTKKAIVKIKEEQIFADSHILTKLPNLTHKHSKMLADIDVYTTEQLETIGALESYLRIKNMHKGINKELLLKLHGAIERKHWKVFTPREQKEIFSQLQLLQ